MNKTFKKYIYTSVGKMVIISISIKIMYFFMILGNYKDLTNIM